MSYPQGGDLTSVIISDNMVISTLKDGGIKWNTTK